MNLPSDPAGAAALNAAILRARARALARPPEVARAAATIEVLRFRLGQEHYAVETRWISEVAPLRDLALLPGAPAHVRGIVNSRGRILPVFDLQKFFDLPEQGITDLHCIVIVRNEELEFGLLADLALGVLSLEAAALQPPPPAFSGVRADYLRGLAPGPLVVLALERIFADPRIIVDAEAST